MVVIGVSKIITGFESLKDDNKFAAVDRKVPYNMKIKSKNCVAMQDTATYTASPREVRQSPLGANGIKLNTLGGDNPSEISLFGGCYNKYLINFKK